MENPIKSTQLRGFFISQSLNSSRSNAVKNECADEYNILPSSSLKFFRKQLNGEPRQLLRKLAAPFHQFSSWQSRRLELIAIPSGLRATPFLLIKHKQALNPQQIGRLLCCFDNSHGSYQVNYCMWLMWWTLARPAEVTEAEWAESILIAPCGPFRQRE